MTEQAYDDLRDRMEALSVALHMDGRAATRRKSYTEGVILRVCSVRIRRELGLESLGYDEQEDTRP